MYGCHDQKNGLTTAGLLMEVADGLHCKQHPTERLYAADIRLRDPGTYHHADLRPGEINLGTGAHQSTLSELVGGSPIQDHYVRSLASPEAGGNRLRRVAQ